MGCCVSWAFRHLRHNTARQPVIIAVVVVQQSLHAGELVAPSFKCRRRLEQLVALRGVLRIVDDGQLAAGEGQPHIAGLGFCARFLTWNDDDVKVFVEPQAIGFLDRLLIVFFEQELHIFLVLRVFQCAYCPRQHRQRFGVPIQRQ